MAGVVDRSQKYVQELVNDGIEVPDQYINKDANMGIARHCLPSIDLPVIDLSHLTSEEELEKLREAFSSWGCFQDAKTKLLQIINHGIESIMEELRDATRQFFHLPIEEKEKYVRIEDDVQGYGSDEVILENQTLDWTDRLFLITTPEDGRKIQLWPENPQSFRKGLHEYSAGVSRIIEILLQSAAKSLELPENSILNKCGDKPISHCRFNFYPPCPRPELVFGLRPHTDGSVVTILLPDEDVEGLQVHKDNQWYRVHTLPRAVVLNAGDQLEILSNGIFKSALHRAVTNNEKERITIALLWTPEKGKGVEPLEALIDEKRPRLYKSVKDYAATTYEAYQKGTKALDAVRI